MRNIAKETLLPTPQELQLEIPLTDEMQETVLETQKSIQEILDGDDERLFVIVGPCSIHDTEVAIEYAHKLKELQVKMGDKMVLVMRTYFEKPRSTVGWKGLLYDPNLDGSHDMAKGLWKSRQLLAQINQMGVPCATEMLDPLTLPFLSDLLSYIAIGARTSESQIHRQAVSGLTIPTGIKNSTDGSVKNAIDAVISVTGRHTMMAANADGQLIMQETAGNEYGHVILRGGKDAPNYSAEAIEEAGNLCDKSMVDSAIVVDCSHQNSQKQHKRQIAVAQTIIGNRVAGETDHLKGIMVESNLFEGNQAIPQDLEELQYGVSITDACLGWDDTKNLLLDLYNQLV